MDQTGPDRRLALSHSYLQPNGPKSSHIQKKYQTQSKFLHLKVKFKLWKVYSLQFPTEPSPYILDLVPQPLTAQQTKNQTQAH